MDDRYETVEQGGVTDADEECVGQVTDAELVASIQAMLDPNKPAMTGKQMIEVMTKNDLFDPRPEMPDSPIWARMLRERAEQRGR